MGSSLEYGKLISPHDEKMKTSYKKLKSIYSKSKLLATNYLLELNKKKFSLYDIEAIFSIWTYPGL